VILPESFNQENGLINTTMKVVRGKIYKYFKKELEFLYTPAAKKPQNDINISAVQKWNS
jgi:long-chain acyl-CoA synthetase